MPCGLMPSPSVVKSGAKGQKGKGQSRPVPAHQRNCKPVFSFCYAACIKNISNAIHTILFCSCEMMAIPKMLWESFFPVQCQAVPTCSTRLLPISRGFPSHSSSSHIFPAIHKLHLQHTVTPKRPSSRASQASRKCGFRYPPPDPNGAK